jgi:hypothetical protein
MSRNPRLLPECYGDSVLVELLGFKRPNHQVDGINAVLDELEKYKPKLNAAGVIDFDKNILHPYYKEFETIAIENNLTKMKHKERNHFLILITPALEKFILKAAMEVDVPSPFSEKRLKQISKTREAENNQQLKQFLNRIIQKKAPGTETLKAWLREIIGDET